MAGRRPKPLAIHQLNGNPRHFSQADLKGADNPQPKPGVPEMPKGMSKGAKREFRKIVPELMALGVLSVIDRRALAAYCDAAAMVEQAEKEVVKYGLVFVSHYPDKDGNLIAGDIKPNPAVAIKLNAMKVMKSFLIEFGLTPASRSKLKVDKAPQDDAMQSFLNRKPGGAPTLLEPMKVNPEDMLAGGDEEEL